MSVFHVGAFFRPGRRGFLQAQGFVPRSKATHPALRSIIRKHETSRLVHPSDRSSSLPSILPHPSFSRHPHLITERFRRTAPLFFPIPLRGALTTLSRCDMMSTDLKTESLYRGAVPRVDRRCERNGIRKRRSKGVIVGGNPDPFGTFPGVGTKFPPLSSIG